MADGIEYVVIERVRVPATEGVGGDDEVWREVGRVTAARKNIVLRDHTPEQGIFNAIPASDWDAAVEVGTESVPKKTVKPLVSKPKRARVKKEAVEA